MVESSLLPANAPSDLWRRDEPLRRAAELIDRSAGRIRAVSFDFFDTLVWRLVGKPTDVFCDVAQRLHEHELLRLRVSPSEFEVLRRHAEVRTRELQNANDRTCEDISIESIYAQMKEVITNPAAAVSIEHGTECDLCVLNPIMASFVQHVRSLGLKTIIVSDIYLSAEQLRAILRANHFDLGAFEVVLTSCGAGLCKGTGNLFKRALQTLNLVPDQLLHVGDNFHADVAGARKAGVRGCHYRTGSPHSWTIFDREKFLLGGVERVFSINSLRLLAARVFSSGTQEATLAQAGAMLMGPILTRFASWACEQFLASGVRRVGALMREGELFGRLLQQEIDARGYDLEVTPLFVNRKATDLAAIGRLTAENLVAWLKARPTLPVRTVIEHFGLDPALERQLPLAPEDKANKPEKILELAKFLFTPEIAHRIEAKSAEERRKILDYMRPWLESGQPFGVCDIGYSASAQTQLKRILDLEGIRTPMVGCYLVSYERAADRVLNGVDIRSFLGAFGHPDFYYRAFIRAPAFMEQALVAGMGTTLGYKRQADGTVVPILDQMPYDTRMLGLQKAFKDGVVEFQRLWHWVNRLRPGLLDGSTPLSRRILADIDRGIAPILARATAFPTKSELTHFGSLALDDYYFEDSYKPLCGEKDREKLRSRGYAKILGEAGVHWPHGVFHMENPSTAVDFFSRGKALLLCAPEGDGDTEPPELSIVLLTGQHATALRNCLRRIRAGLSGSLTYEVLLIIPKGHQGILAVAHEFSRQFLRVRIYECSPEQPTARVINEAADSSFAPFLMLADDDVLFPNGWDVPVLDAMRSGAETGAVLSSFNQRSGTFRESDILRGMVIRRSAFMEGLALKEGLTLTGTLWYLLIRIREAGWKIRLCQAMKCEGRTAEIANMLTHSDGTFLTQSFPEFHQWVASLFLDANQTTRTADQRARFLNVDWIGSFLDFGSLSHVNRELTRAIQTVPGIRLQRVTNGATVSDDAAKLWPALARAVVFQPSADAAITVRHAWPPNWKRPAQGKLVVIQPWEFGALPVDWVRRSREVDEFWVPSKAVQRCYEESGVEASKIQVVPNGIDPDGFRPDAAPRKLPTNKRFKFLFVGGTIRRKGPDVLLNAYLNHFTAADDVCLVIKDFGGSGVYAGLTFESHIRAAQSRPNAPEILCVKEELTPEELPGLYTACDCLVHPYRGEGFGLPILEAMACGLPVIVTAGGAADDFAGEDVAYRIPAQRVSIGDSESGIKLAGNGWLLEPDPAALGERMKWVVTHRDEARAKGARASEYARREWTWERAARIAGGRLQTLAAPASETAYIAEKKTECMVQKPAVAELPSCARLGQLQTAREWWGRKQHRQAWDSAIGAVQARPFHPEAFLLLAQIAAEAGDAVSARQWAEHARELAPDWKAPKQFLQKSRKGNARPEWLVLPEALANSQSHAAPRLSVCVIAKNEEQFLGQCLASVKELASQIIVGDTGSTDRTVEIAKAHGAEVHHFEWNDDFSAARNAALEHATGDWVLVLDADEELTAQGREALRQHLRKTSVMAYRLPIVDAGKEKEGCHYVPRLFRNAPGVFFSGRIHEHAFGSLEPMRRRWGLDNQLGSATLLHHGYKPELVASREKIERNLRLLRLAVEEDPEDANLLMNLGLETVRSGNLQDGLGHYRKAFQILSVRPSEQVTPELRETLLTQMATHWLAAGEFEDTYGTV